MNGPGDHFLARASLADDQDRRVGIGDAVDQIEYRDQDPRIHKMFVEELARKGLGAKMEEFGHSARDTTHA